jgi:pSer/pThr/pTyr-binding forkhead associated (FHA) protein
MSEEDRTITRGSTGDRKKGAALPAGLRIYLEVVEGPDKGKKFELESTLVVLGRKNADVVLTDSTVSSRHATLEVGREDILLYDENSTNGTFVNDTRITSCPMKNLDEIQVGETRLLLSVIQDRYGIYHEDFAQEQQEYEGDDTVTSEEAPLDNPPLADNLEVVLEVEDGPNLGQRYKLSRRSTLIGRRGADIILDDDRVSTRHAQIEVHNKDKMTIKDLASKNGTEVNGRLVSAVKLRTGDKIKTGNTVMAFYARVKS